MLGLKLINGSKRDCRALHSVWSLLKISFRFFLSYFVLCALYNLLGYILASIKSLTQLVAHFCAETGWYSRVLCCLISRCCILVSNVRYTAHGEWWFRFSLCRLHLDCFAVSRQHRTIHCFRNWMTWNTLGINDAICNLIHTKGHMIHSHFQTVAT